MHQARSEPSKNLALDIMLRTFMNSTEFQNLKIKNWDSVAKLVPGITAKQVKKITSRRDYWFTSLLLWWALIKVVLQINKLSRFYSAHNGGKNWGYQVLVWLEIMPVWPRLEGHFLLTVQTTIIFNVTKTDQPEVNRRSLIAAWKLEV